MLWKQRDWVVQLLLHPCLKDCVSETMWEKPVLLGTLGYYCLGSCVYQELEDHGGRTSITEGLGCRRGCLWLNSPDLIGARES